jgi:predicted metal-dependent peptidase
MFFNELENLTKLVSIDVIPFDCSIDKEHLTPWKKGAKVKHERKLTGGTDFDAPTQFANSDENRGRWDALIIFTDGYAPKPRDSRVKRAWAMIPGYKIKFPTDDLIINMTYEESEGN